jgi:hypothetical protein
VLGDRFSSSLNNAQAGDAEAFALLFRDLGPVVIRYLRALSVSWPIGGCVDLISC